MLHLDDAVYDRIDSDEVPLGFSSVPVKIDDKGDKFEALMVAGSVGVNCASSENELAGGLVELGTLSIESGWWIFERKSQAVLDAEKAARDRALQ